MLLNLPQGTTLQGTNATYTIVRVLGQGSFGITYLAQTQIAGALGTIDVNVAVKEFFMKEINSRSGNTVTGGSSTSDGLFDKYRQKFRREAKNLSRMQHPGIVKVLDSFDANGTSYIVMDYVCGGSLDSHIAFHPSSLSEKDGRRPEGGLPEEEALRLTRGIGDALAYMHAHHMLHLDLKPSNVMLNDQEEPILIDFGLSKHYDENGAPESSTTRAAILRAAPPWVAALRATPPSSRPLTATEKDFLSPSTSTPSAPHSSKCSPVNALPKPTR